MKISYKDKYFEVKPLNENEHIQNFWANGVFYEEKMLEYINDNYAKGLSFLDVGGCVGNHALFFAGIMDAESVTIFEPIEILFDSIKENLALNSLLDKCKLYNVALTDRKKRVKMLLSDMSKNAGMSKIDSEGDYVANAIRLDSLSFDMIDLIKIDIEGSNKNMLIGAKKTILKHKPDIFIEADVDFDEVNEILESYGYKYSGLQFNRTPTFLFKSL